MGIEELQLSYIATALNATVLEHFGLKKYSISKHLVFCHQVFRPDDVVRNTTEFHLVWNVTKAFQVVACAALWSGHRSSCSLQPQLFLRASVLEKRMTIETENQNRQNIQHQNHQDHPNLRNGQRPDTPMPH